MSSHTANTPNIPRIADMESEERAACSRLVDNARYFIEFVGEGKNPTLTDVSTRLGELISNLSDAHAITIRETHRLLGIVKTSNQESPNE